MDTLRRVARALSLLALDFAAIFLAIVTALGLKAAARDTFDLSVALHQAKDYVSFAFLVTALLFAKAGLYGDRAVRPGLSSIVASLFQVDGRGRALRDRQRPALLQLLHLLRVALLRRRLRRDVPLRLRAD